MSAKGISVIIYACNRIKSLDMVLTSLRNNSRQPVEVILVEDFEDAPPPFDGERIPGFMTCRELLDTRLNSYVGGSVERIVEIPYSKAFYTAHSSERSWHRVMAQAINEGAQHATKQWLAIFGNTDIYYGPWWDEQLLRAATESDNVLVPVVIFAYMQANDAPKVTPGFAYDRADAYWTYLTRFHNETNRQEDIPSRDDCMITNYHISEKHFLRWVRETGIWKPGLITHEDGGHRKTSSQYAHVVRAETFNKLGGLPVGKWHPNNDDVWNDWDDLCKGSNLKVGVQGSITLTTEFAMQMDATLEDKKIFALAPKVRCVQWQGIRTAREQNVKKARGSVFPLRTVFLGGGLVGSNVLDTLLSTSNLQVGLAVLNPHDPARVTDRTPMMLQTCNNLKIPCVASRMTAQIQQRIIDYAPDLIVIGYYDYIIPSKVFSVPWMGCINLHLGDPQKHRGCFPTTRALLAGDQQCRVVVHYVDEGVDSGPILGSRFIPIDPRWTGADLYLQAGVHGVVLLRDTLLQIVRGRVVVWNEPKSQVSYPREFPSREIHLTQEQQSAVRAFTYPPFPPPFVNINGTIYHIKMAFNE